MCRMNKRMWYPAPVLAVLFFMVVTVAWAAPAPTDYTTTYSITLAGDGSAFWTVEYRTPIVTDDDMNNFENYSADLDSVYLPQLEDLMQHAASQASAGTSRPMTVGNFSGKADVQTSPTGRFGVITYSFSWTNFGVADNSLSIGDAFASGMYLDKDSMLVIQYPRGYTVRSAEPPADKQTSDGLVWYGVRSFGDGEPDIVLDSPSFPFLPAALGIIIIVAVSAGIIGYRVHRRKKQPPHPEDPPDDPDDPAPQLTETDIVTLENRIIRLIEANGGEQFQSEIVRVLGMPKSTVSATLNDLHRKGAVQKVRKGRENLIRLVRGGSLPATGPGDPGDGHRD